MDRSFQKNTALIKQQTKNFANGVTTVRSKKSLKPLELSAITKNLPVSGRTEITYYKLVHKSKRPPLGFSGGYFYIQKTVLFTDIKKDSFMDSKKDVFGI